MSLVYDLDSEKLKELSDEELQFVKDAWEKEKSRAESNYIDLYDTIQKIIAEMTIRKVELFGVYE